MKLNRKLVLFLSLVLSLALATGGTLAYLSDTDADVNTMTLGSVYIVQNEQERDAQGDLVPYTQDKPLYPAVFDGDSIPWAPAEKWPTKDDQAWKVVADNELVIDKFVTVTNTGKSEAYVRTFIAYEGDETYGPNGDFIHIVHNTTNVDPAIIFKDHGVITVDGVAYTVFSYTYPTALQPRDTTIPSLKQVYMNKDANNDVVAKYGEKYEIRVVSQAVQTNGFADAQTALDQAFPVSETALVEWFGGAESNIGSPSENSRLPQGWPSNNPPSFRPSSSWDELADTSWYVESEEEFTIKTPEQLAGFAKLVDSGISFENKTVKLGKNIDLLAVDNNGEYLVFDPIGDKSPFAGTFDGQGYAIQNMYQSGWAFGYEWGRYGSIGLFGELTGATVKNLTISGADSQIEGGDIGGITGSATGNCTFENITIEDSAFGTYNNGNGGIIGWSGAGTYTFKNITIADDVVLAGLWGSFDSSIGGMVGQGEPGATYNFENVEINCRIDAYNDCTASYDYYNYRMCGMIIGRLEKTTTIDGANYPDTSKYNINCSNVTVNYGDWMNYHYCDPTPGHNNGRGMRVEPGYAYGGLPADYDHSTCTQHCNELIPFDQIFGGAQYGVKGLKTYEGVTVNYPD